MEKKGGRREIEESTSMKRAPLPGLYPWLVYKHGEKDHRQTFCNILESSGGTTTSRRYIPELRNKMIFACSYGWVVLRDKKGTQYSLWNPVTSESISLPPLDLKPDQYIFDCLLTDSPRNIDSKILLFGANFYSIMCCHLCSHNRWIEIRYYNQIENLKKEKNLECFLGSPVSCNGKIYATTFHYRKLFLIELDKSNNLKVSLLSDIPWAQQLNSPVTSYFLVESIGEIIYIAFNLGGGMDNEYVAYVEVFKFDFCSRTWAKLTSAKDRLFFLGNNYNISLPTRSSNVEGSRIYFTRRKDKHLYSYNMEDQSIRISLPCIDLSTPYEPRPYWIMPDVNLTNAEEPKEMNVNVSVSGSQYTEKKKQVAVEEKVERISLKDLPWPALNEIARRLTFVGYMNFRAVCSAFCSVAPPIRWKTEFAASKSLLLFPCLIFPETYKGIYNLVDSNLNNRFFLTIPDILQDTAIRCSKYGWLVMSKHHSVTLFNPFTKDIIQLPDNNDMLLVDTSFILTDPPSSQDCRIIWVSIMDTMVGVSIIYPGENEWEYYERHRSEKFVERTFNNGVYYQEALYFLNVKGMLEVLKMGDELIWESLVEPVAPCTSFQQNYLVECDGHLLAIFVGKLGESVQVFKLNFSKLIWEEVTNLKNHTLYISSSSSFALEVKDAPEIANRIYFPRLHNQSIVFYSLDTGKFHALGAEEDLCMNYYNTRCQLDCGWIEPSWC